MSLSSINPTKLTEYGLALNQLLEETQAPRLGELLLDKGLIQAEDLERAFAYQHAQSTKGEVKLLGQILIELGLIEPETLEKVVVQQILALQTALQNFHQNNDILKENQRLIQREIILTEFTSKLWALNNIDSILHAVIQELRESVKFSQGLIQLSVSQTIPDTLEPFEDISR